jgi:hypothetical protein
LLRIANLTFGQKSTVSKTAGLRGRKREGVLRARIDGKMNRWIDDIDDRHVHCLHYEGPLASTISY